MKFNYNDGYHVGECYYCHQGNAYILKQPPADLWFVQCEECGAEWPSPKDFLDCKSSLIGKYERTTLVTKEEIQPHPWRQYVINFYGLDEE